jgi:hypothetical protein
VEGGVGTSPSTTASDPQGHAQGSCRILDIRWSFFPTESVRAAVREIVASDVPTLLVLLSCRSIQCYEKKKGHVELALVAIAKAPPHVSCMTVNYNNACGCGDMVAC